MWRGRCVSESLASLPCPSPVGACLSCVVRRGVTSWGGGAGVVLGGAAFVVLDAHCAVAAEVDPDRDVDVVRQLVDVLAVVEGDDEAVEVEVVLVLGQHDREGVAVRGGDHTHADLVVDVEREARGGVSGSTGEAGVQQGRRNGALCPQRQSSAEAVLEVRTGVGGLEDVERLRGGGVHRKVLQSGCST